MSLKRSKYVKPSKVPKLSRKQLYAIVAITVIVVSSLAVYAFFNKENSGFKVAIVDQLSSRAVFVNATFVKTVNETVTAAGYTLTYYNSSEITVDFYRTLPTHGYKIILLRVHSALFNGTDAPLDFFTAEPYDAQKYPYDQLNKWLDIAMYYRGGDQFFGILHGFVANAMQGDFQDAVIILMGCNGLDKYARSQSMLQALVGKGVKVLIGWDDAVSGPRTDGATTKLLHRLLIENKTIKDAVNATMNEVGQEPMLRYYPSKDFHLTTDVGNYTIPHGSSQPASAQTGGGYPVSFNIMSVGALPLLMRHSRRFFVFCRSRRRNSP